MSVKIAEAQEEGVEFPAVRAIGDALRGSFAVRTSEGVFACWELLKRNFKVIRLKNKASSARAFYI